MLHIEFYTAPWCPQCKAMHPIIDAVQEKTKVPVKTIELTSDTIEQHPQILNLPTLIFYDEHKVLQQTVGVISQTKLEEVINKWKETLK